LLEFYDSEEEEEAPWCFRGYPFQCPFEEALQFVEIDDPDTLFILDDVCSNCPLRLEYEKYHRDFIV